METAQLTRLCLGLCSILMTSPLICVISTVVGENLPCPAPCECYKKIYDPYGQLNTIMCSNLGLTAVPDLSSLTKSPIPNNLVLSQNEIKEISIDDFPPGLNIVVMNLNQNSGVKIATNAFLNLGYCLRTASLEAIDLTYEKTLVMLDGLFSLDELFLNNNNKHPYVEGAVQNVEAALFQGEVAKHLKRLQLAYCGIRTLSDESLASLVQLEELDLSNNWFTSIPAVIKLLPNLKYIEFFYSQIDSLKDNDFSGLKHLEKIDLSSNSKLKTIAANAFSGCEESLEKLNLQRCSLSEVPTEAMKNLKKLNFLDLSENVFTKIGPGSFIGDYKLTELMISALDLEFDDDTFKGQESNILELSIPRMNLKTIPKEALSKLTSLRRLSLEYNNITSLPANAFEGIKASSIRLEYNPLSSIDPGAFDGLPPNLVISLRRTKMADIEFLQGYSDEAINTVDLEHTKLVCRCSMKAVLNVTHNIHVYGSCAMGEKTVHISSSKLEGVLEQACEMEKRGNSGNAVSYMLLSGVASLVLAISIK